LRSASEELAALVASSPSSRVPLLKLGELATRLSDRKRMLASGSALLGLCAIQVPRDGNNRPIESSASRAALAWLASPAYAERVAEVERYFRERKLYRDLADLAEAQSRSEPLNLVMLDLALDTFGNWGRERARILLANIEQLTKAAGALPADSDVAAWKQGLAARRERLGR
jgi:hypothetical protein